MDGSDNSFSSSTPIKTSATPKMSESDTGETSENNQTNHQIGLKLQTPKKTTTKNFMSATISAASKAVVPRKKILAERNEASEPIFSDTHLQKTPILDSNSPLPTPGIDNFDVSLSRVTPLSSQASEFHDDEQNTFVADSSLRPPYDPLTNYLSPRPKFLCNKPDRSRQIFLREGNDGLSVNRNVSFDSKKAVEEETSVGACGYSASSSEEDSVKEEDEEIEEEIEEVEEEGGCNLKGVLKTLLIFVVLFLSTLYISSMNSPTPSPALQAIRDLKDDYVKIQNQIFGAASVKIFEGGSEFLDQREETQLGLVEVNQRDIDEMVENTDELEGVIEPQAGGSEMVEMVDDENKRTVDEMGEVMELQAGGSEAVCDHEMEITRKVSDQMGENIESQGIEIAEKLDSLQDYQIPFMSDRVDHHDMVSDVVNASKKEVNTDANPKDEDEDWVLIEEIADEGDREEVVENEMERVEDSIEKAGEVVMLDTKVNSVEELMEYTETESISKAVIGAAIFFAIVASLVLGFYLKPKKNSAKDSLPSGKTCSEFVIPEKSSSVLLNEGEYYNEKVHSFVNPSSLIHLMEEASEEFYESRAPKVELLGEFVVGKISSSLKSCGMKSRLIMESEESNSVSQERSQNKAHTVPIHGQLTLSEFSAMGSPSYGSFTAEEKILKKEEEGRGGKVVTTPVRRSGRIRNRTVTSP